MSGIIRNDVPLVGTIEVQKNGAWVDDDQIEILNYKAFEEGTGFIKYRAAHVANWKGNRPVGQPRRIKTDTFTEVLAYRLSLPAPQDPAAVNIVTVSCIQEATP